MSVPWQIILCLAMIAVSFGLLDAFTPMMGDDLAKWNDVGGEDYSLFSVATVRYVYSHYLTVNGRILDSTGALLTAGLPGWGASVLMGLMAAFYFLMMGIASGLIRRGRATAFLALVCATIIIMPWWDSMWLRVCQYGYMWSTAFCLLFFTLFFRYSSAKATAPRMAISICIGIITGFSHEQTGLSTASALFIYSIVYCRYRRFNKLQWTLCASLVVGVICILANPGLRHRVETSNIKVGIDEMLLSTLPAICILAGCIAVMAATVAGRKRLRSLVEGPWTAYVTLAVAASAIALFSRVVGRTGWLPESAAIIAVALLLDTLQLRIGRTASIVCSTLLFGAIAAHYAYTVVLQHRLYKEYNDVLEQYMASDDGIVYYDAHFRPDFGPLALGHAQGVPDADDLYLLDEMRAVYRGDSVPLTVLPTAFRGRLGTIADSMSANGYVVYATMPQNFARAVDETQHDTIRIIGSPPQQYILQAFRPGGGRTLWAASPLIIDKGDHWNILSEQNQKHP